MWVNKSRETETKVNIKWKREIRLHKKIQEKVKM